MPPNSILVFYVIDPLTVTLMYNRYGKYDKNGHILENENSPMYKYVSLYN